MVASNTFFQGMAGVWENKNAKITNRKLIFNNYCNCEFGLGRMVGVFLWTVHLSCVLSHCLPMLFGADPLALPHFKLGNLRSF